MPEVETRLQQLTALLPDFTTRIECTRADVLQPLLADLPALVSSRDGPGPLASFTEPAAVSLKHVGRPWLGRHAHRRLSSWRSRSCCLGT
jgi:hypothetical protein